MKISTKGRYALRVMIDLANNEEGDIIPLKVIAQRQDISIKYLEIIVGMLCKAGFVISSRGKGGGYKLSRPPEEYSVGSILKITEGSIAPVDCISYGKSVCGRAEHCPTFPLWEGLNKVIDDYLESITIKDLMLNSQKISELAERGNN